MKKLMQAMFLGLLIMFVSATTVLADTIGYADFKKIETEYAFAQKTYKDLDEKIISLQQFLINKDKEYKAIESPLSKKAFEEKTEKEYKVKEESILKLKLQKEQEIFNNITAAAKIVSAQKKIDVVFDIRVILTGGVDITDDIIAYLNNSKVPAKQKTK